MKYSAFKKEMKRKGLTVTLTDDGYLYIKNNKATIGRISLRRTGSLSTDFKGFDNFGGGFKRMLLQTFAELSMTPLDKREDEKRYRLRLPFVKDDLKHLAMCKSTGDLIISYPTPYDENYQNVFTESEIETLKVKHNLDSFILDEVKKDE